MLRFLGPPARPPTQVQRPPPPMLCAHNRPMLWHNNVVVARRCGCVTLRRCCGARTTWHGRCCLCVTRGGGVVAVTRRGCCATLRAVARGREKGKGQGHPPSRTLVPLVRRPPPPPPVPPLPSPPLSPRSAPPPLVPGGERPRRTRRWHASCMGQTRPGGQKGHTRARALLPCHPRPPVAPRRVTAGGPARREGGPPWCPGGGLVTSFSV
jgi:hypothetical protein